MTHWGFSQAASLGPKTSISAEGDPKKRTREFRIRMKGFTIAM
jgi:hypothetical protein